RQDRPETIVHDLDTLAAAAGLVGSDARDQFYKEEVRRIRRDLKQWLDVTKRNEPRFGYQSTERLDDVLRFLDEWAFLRGIGEPATVAREGALLEDEGFLDLADEIVANYPYYTQPPTQNARPVLSDLVQIGASKDSGFSIFGRIRNKALG